MMLKEKSVREKICSDFFPNCGICSCFSECFPKTGLNDELSELALLEQIMGNGTLNNFTRKNKNVTSKFGDIDKN